MILFRDIQFKVFLNFGKYNVFSGRPLAGSPLERPVGRQYGVTSVIHWG